MKLKQNLGMAVVMSALSISLFSCKKEPKVTPTPTTKDYVLTGEITSDKTLSAEHVWTLKGYVYVKSGATLTVPAGTVIKSDLLDKGALIVERGAKILAEGTASKPIVFTSGQVMGQRRPGDWGGIILLGKAPTNRSTEPTIEGGVNRQYGGADANDNSGVLKYVRIEFAGIAAAQGSEINGLTCGGVGAGTTLENIMVSYGNDDAYEFFGGTVNAKNLVAFACLDDDFDFDFGYTGNIQFGISIKHPQFADNGDAANGIESDNDASGSSAAPFTHPVLSNFTFIGPNSRSNTAANHNFGNRWRRSAHFTIRNSILMGHQKGGFSLESAATVNSYLNDQSQFKNNIIHAVTAVFKSDQSIMTAAAMEAKAIVDGCLKLNNADDALLTDAFSLAAPNLLPKTGSPALSGASFNGMSGYFVPTTFIGAMGSNDWTGGWTNWDPVNAAY